MLSINQGRKTRQAFTLAECLVTTACIVVVSLTLITVLSRTRSQTHAELSAAGFSAPLFALSPEPSPHSSSPAIPSLARICTPPNQRAWVSVSGFCHVLDYYGLGQTDLPDFPTGASVLQALTDEATAVRVFGKSPFQKTPDGLCYALFDDESINVDVGEAHQDQCLALFGALGLPLSTPVHLLSGNRSLADLFSASLSRFRLDQHEIEWSAMAFARYLPPQTTWTNRLGNCLDFNQLVEALLHTDLNEHKCAGLHVFEALILISNSDKKTPLLTATTRQQLHDYLRNTIQEIIQSQHADGSWSKSWCAAVKEQSDHMTPFDMSFLVTGHLCEILPELDASYRPPGQVFQNAAGWVKHSMNSPDIRANGFWICPYTHAARGARDILDGTYQRVY
jgi:hypothetical protein